jgi:AcrR family transcriptional regulator
MEGNPSADQAAPESSARAAKVGLLLEAALPEFASAGLAGARVDAIARAAGMNKRLLYHYVGDKSALFAATLDLAYDRVLKAPDALHGDEWRLICHGVACGRTARISELLRLADSAENPAGAQALGLKLLAGLLPELADHLLGNAEGSDAGRLRALGTALRALTEEAGSPPAKPRLKLRPDLRRG